MTPGNYPPDWDAIAKAVKDKAGWRCVRCGHPRETRSVRAACDEKCDAARHPGGLNDGKQRILTVHHLDMNPANCEWYNLAVLCQVCHLTIQGKVKLDQVYMFEHSAWFKPFLAGYYQSILGGNTDEWHCRAHADAIIANYQKIVRVP